MTNRERAVELMEEYGHKVEIAGPDACDIWNITFASGDHFGHVTGEGLAWIGLMLQRGADSDEWKQALVQFANIIRKAEQS